MLGVADDEISTLTKVLDLLLVTERELEPWICDIVCDNVRAVIKFCSSRSDLEDNLCNSLQAIVNKDISNVKLKLRIMSIVLPCFDFVRLHVLSYLESYPAEVFEICSHLLPGITATSVPINAESSIKTLEEDAKEFSNLMSKLRESSKSVYVPVRKAACQFMAKYCITHYIACDSNDLASTLLRFHPQFLCDILNDIYNYKEDGKSIAFEIMDKSLSRALSSKKVKHLSKLMAYQAATHLTSTVSQGAGYLTDHPNFGSVSAELHLQVFYRELVSLLLEDDKGDIVEEIFEGVLVLNKNIILVSVISKAILAANDDLLWQKIVSGLIITMGFLLDIMDSIYNECASIQEKRGAVSILEDIAGHDDLFDVIEGSSSKTYLCFMSTYLTHLAECSADSFSMLSNFTAQLLNDPHFSTSCESLHPQLASLLLRKLSHGNSRERDLVLDVVGALNQNVIDPSVLDHVLLLSYTDEDYYVRSSCFKVLSRCTRKNLPGALSGQSSVETLNSIIRSIEYDDSIVAISFFGFLQAHFYLISDLIRDNTAVLLEPVRAEVNGSRPEVSDGKPSSRDVDAVIDEICNSSDCADVPLISAYEDKRTEEFASSPNAHLVCGVFRLLGLDRCDVERMKASIQLMTGILGNLDDEGKGKVVTFLERGYFELVESVNSPFLNETIRDFNSVLDGVRTFSELKCRKNQSLMTVLTLLESTPDPDIVIDCY